MLRNAYARCSEIPSDACKVLVPNFWIAMLNIVKGRERTCPMGGLGNPFRPPGHWSSEVLKSKRVPQADVACWVADSTDYTAPIVKAATKQGILMQRPRIVLASWHADLSPDSLPTVDLVHCGNWFASRVRGVACGGCRRFALPIQLRGNADSCNRPSREG